MSFLEIFERSGCVKPCHCRTYQPDFGPGVRAVCTYCRDCRGTGWLFDLAPLLARPTLLSGIVEGMIQDWWAKNPDQHTMAYDNFKKPYKLLHVVGPQRAHALVYEVARQLGGTAVVVIDVVAPKLDYSLEVCNRQFSFPISDATVLLVTDKLDEREMSAVMDVVMESAPKDKPHKFLPYVLTLVSDRESWVFPDPEKSEWPVIALHQEKP